VRLAFDDRGLKDAEASPATYRIVRRGSAPILATLGRQASSRGLADALGEGGRFRSRWASASAAGSSSQARSWWAETPYRPIIPRAAAWRSRHKASAGLCSDSPAESAGRPVLPSFGAGRLAPCVTCDLTEISQYALAARNLPGRRRFVPFFNGAGGAQRSPFFS
jgi:hypothetical protein